MSHKIKCRRNFRMKLYTEKECFIFHFTLYCAALAEDFGPGHVGRSVGPFPQVRRRSWVSSEDAWPGEELETWHDGTPDLFVFKKFAGIMATDRSAASTSERCPRVQARDGP